MAKIKLGAAPKNFKKTVKFLMLDGTTGSIEMSYLYRTRKEFGALVDEARAEAVKEAADLDTGATFTLEGHLAATDLANADYLLKIADGWDVEADFTHATCEQLGDELPAAIVAIVDGYRLAVTEGSLGN